MNDPINFVDPTGEIPRLPESKPPPNAPKFYPWKNEKERLREKKADEERKKNYDNCHKCRNTVGPARGCADQAGSIF